MVYWEFTAYIDHKGETWEGVGYWPVLGDHVLVRGQLRDMAESLYCGIAGHGFSELFSLQTTLEAVDLSGPMLTRVQTKVRYREDCMNGIGLSWSKLEAYRGQK